MGKLKDKLKIGRRGSVPLTILVGMLAMVSLLLTIMLASNERYSNIQTGEKITSRYLGESSLDIQKYLMHNKLDNKELKIYFYEMSAEDTGGDPIRIYLTGDNLFEQEEIRDGEIQSISMATNMIMDEQGKYGNIKNIKTSVKLQDPDNAYDTEIRYMCKESSFLTESPGDDVANIKCKLEDFTISSDVTYLGGRINALYDIKNVSIIREPYFSADVMETVIDGEKYNMGYVYARLDTENIKIVTKSFQNYRAGGDD